MKKYLLLALLLSGCGERYTSVIKDVTPKANMIEVDTIVNQYVLSFDGGQFDMKRSTVPATFKGAGVFISKRGHILTCAHLFDVIPGSTITVILANGIRLPAKLIYQDVDKDLALVKVDGTYKSASIYNKITTGQEVIVVGNPRGLGFSVSHGIISYVGRDIDEEYTFTQTDAPINPGNSGGPVFNLDGELVGIAARKMPDSDGLGFAISPNTIKQFLDTFRGLDDAI